MSSTAISQYLVTDDLTILLGLIAATVFLLQNLYKPQPLVHPILLGRQSDVARVRNPGESAVYRNYGTGLMGRFPMRPNKDVHALTDLVKPDSDVPRTLWSTKITNIELIQRASRLSAGLLHQTGLQPYESNVLLLLNDGLEFLISDLALASNAIPSFTIASLDLLSPVLESHPPSAIITHAHFLPQILELIYDASEHSNHTIIVVGDFDDSVGSQVNVLKWTDIEHAGSTISKLDIPVPKPSDVFTVSFFASETGHLQGAQLTHENITAGVAAIRALLPLSNSISSLDTIVSAHSLSTAYGRAIAYTAIFDGTAFTTLDSTKLFLGNNVAPKDPAADIASVQTLSLPSPTILFIKPDHLTSLTSSVMKEAEKSSVLFHLAWSHKLSGVSEGFITKDSLWDRLLFDSARAQIVGEAAGTLRGIVVSGGHIERSTLTPARIAFSVPIVNTYTHPLVAGPVLASHPLDLQTFPLNTTDPLAHVGAPSINIEAKLVGVADDLVENGADPEGVLLVRGPPVGALSDLGDDGESDRDGWVGTGVRAKVQTNGAFKILAQ